MARIRSLHPGQAIDEDFVEMSRDARLFTLLLRCEAGDQGVFEWKPRRLKMAIFPADDVDIEAILSELVANRQVLQYEAEGKQYGVIRNFRRWQRPKKPNSVHPLAAKFRTYAGLDWSQFPTGTEPCGDEVEEVPNQFPTGTENPPQMEDVGCRREDILGASAPDGAAPPDPFDRFWSLYPKRKGANPRKPAKAKFEKICAAGEDPERIIAGARRLAIEHPKPTPYVPQATRWLNEERYVEDEPGPTPVVDDGLWGRRLSYGRENQTWFEGKWGPIPGRDGCEVPPRLLREGDGHGWRNKSGATT